MKMNDLDALLAVLNTVGTATHDTLAPYRPKLYSEAIGGRTAAEVGCIPILHMRDFQSNGTLSDALVTDIRNRRS